jgi:hypothetical protein
MTLFGCRGGELAQLALGQVAHIWSVKSAKKTKNEKKAGSKMKTLPKESHQAVLCDGIGWENVHTTHAPHPRDTPA